MVAVSVVMSVYNRERFVAEAIESVLNQTFEDFEFLIWDDGSTDGSLAIAREYEKQDKRVRVVAAEHTGLSPALRKAIALTTGEFLGWVDSDDRLAERALERTVALLREKADVGMVYTDYVVMDEAGRVRGKGRRCQVPYSIETLLLNFITFHFRLLRRDVYEQMGGVRAEFVYAQDYDLCLRLSEVTEVAHLQEELYAYRNHGKNISHEKQVEQIGFTYEAILQAIKRRNMSEKFKLEVQLRPRFLLRSK